jgi:SAM-dependent methyltransferase
LAPFAAAIGVSAFLLFWIEPLIGQVILPVFGGAPAVWATTLVFFQAAVLVGYLYSHLSATRLSPRRGLFVHLVLAAFALGWLAAFPIRQSELQAAQLPAALDVLRILALGIGPPVAVLTATTPLVSAWYVAARRSSAAADARTDPYQLYALSNAASMAALIAYPLFIGPRLGLSSQLSLWAIAFLGLCAILGLVAVLTFRWARPRESVRASDAGLRTDVIGWRRRATWILLAAVPSGLLAAVTNYIATDLIAAPLLWVGPLALYLGSFIVAFSARGRRIVPLALALAPAAITLLWTPIGTAGGWPIVPLVGLEWMGLAVVATALHGRLANDRPPEASLTQFYLVQSIGGVAGGAFVAIVAPLLFDGIWEYPILLVAALLALAITGPSRQDRAVARSAAERPARQPARPIVDLRPFISGARQRLGPYALVAGALVLAMALERSIALPYAVRWFVVGALILLVGAPPRFLAVSTALVLTIATFVIPMAALMRDRSFFGVTEVLMSSDGGWVHLMNGTTVHGSQSTDPELSRTATSYYAPSGPLGDVFVALDAARPNAEIAIVGLGAGAIASFQQPTQTMTFYEIDPVVVGVATDPRYFTYLADRPVQPGIVLGDGRLSLRAEADSSFDLVILDAFSSDAVPAHLLTVEALLDCRRVLRHGGMLAINVSNRYFDLAPAIGAAADDIEMIVLERRYSPTLADSAVGASPSIWVLATADAATANRFREAGWGDTAHAGVAPLTDDHPDVLRFLDLGS